MKNRDDMAYIKTVLSLLLILSLTVFACSADDEEENGNADLGDFPLQGFADLNISSMLMVVQETSGGFDAYLRLFIKENHQVLSLQIDGNNIELFKFEGFYFADLNLLPGQSFTYRLRIDDKIRTGSLSVPALIRGTFPITFNFSSNFTMSWTTSADPTGFIALMQIDLFDDWIDSSALLPGTARSHTFSSSIYAGLSGEDVDFIDVGVLGINFQMKDGMPVIAAFDSYREYEFDGGPGSRLEKQQIARERPRGRLFGANRHLAVPVE